MGDFNSTLFRQLAEGPMSRMQRDNKMTDTWTPAQLATIEKYKDLIWKILMRRAEQLMQATGQDRLVNESERFAQTQITLSFVSRSANVDSGGAHTARHPSIELGSSLAGVLNILTENFRIDVDLSPIDFGRDSAGGVTPRESAKAICELVVIPLVCP